MLCYFVDWFPMNAVNEKPDKKLNILDIILKLNRI